jgi:hypothetical protein
MRQGDYILILAPMVSELKLSGNNLIIFALIYGFSKDDAHKFSGSIDYICKWTNLSRPTVIATLKTLTECGYLNKEELVVNNVKTCLYTTNYNSIIEGSKETLPVVKKFNQGGKETLLNIDIYNDNDKSLSTTNNKQNTDEIKDKWEETNPNLPSIRCFNEKRKKALRTLLKNNNATIDDLYKVFEIISVCSFCQGSNDRGWTATLDWVLNDTKSCFNRLLEGAYAFNDSEKQKVQQIVSGVQVEQTQSEQIVINGVIYK